jgi:hypothetical protein
MVTERVAVAVFEAESVSLTLKLALPTIGVAPERTPPLERVSPTVAGLPDVTVQVSPVPVPPELVRVCE